MLEEANPGDPSLCLFLSDPANLASGQVPCGPFGEDSTYVTSMGHAYVGTRAPLGSSFGSNANQATIGNSNYDALQIILRHGSKRLDVLAGSAFSKSERTIPSNVRRRGNSIQPTAQQSPCSVDVKHNFVASYNYRLPLDSLFAPRCLHPRMGDLLLSLIFCSSGLPVTLINYGDNSLLRSEPNRRQQFWRR